MAKDNFVLRCPVCGHPLADDICPGCGYVHISFPSSVPKAIEEFQKKRIETLKEVEKRHSDDLADAKGEAAAAWKQAEKFRTELGQANETVKTQNGSIASLNARNGQLKEDLTQKEQIYEKERQAATKDKKQLNTKITDLQSVINLQTAEIQNLKNNLKEAQSKLIQLSETPSKTLKGFVIVEDVKYSKRVAFPVYEGLNTYGSDPDKDTHCQIKFRVSGFRFLPVHFSVRTSAKGLILTGANGANIYQNNGLIKSGVYARQGDDFMLDDKVRVNINGI